MLNTSGHFNIKDIKLIIWDLDNTFWNGTLTEGGCTRNEENIKFLKELTDRGIVNSICSKNTFSECQEKLEKWNLWKYFVFPSIDWSSKGKRVHRIIKDMGLRPCNVLFLDDEPANLQAVSQYVPDIMCSSIENCIEDLLDQLESIPIDKSRKRLKRYQELQKKVEIKNTFDSDEEFLRLSKIKVEIKKDCVEHIDRILELINRTNQLNFTKKRIDLIGLKSLLSDNEYKCGYITCTDKYSEYGIVGFYALEEETNRLEHFLFSCRTIGMGVEQYVYASLKFPQLNVIGEVVQELSDKGRPDWISECYEDETKKHHILQKKPNIIAKGPCDVSQVVPFFSGGANFCEEFAYVSEEKKGTYIESHNHSSQILDSLYKDPKFKSRVEKNLFFVDSKYYKTNLFSEEYDYFIYSVLTDYSLGMYENKNDNSIIVPFGQYTVDYTKKENWNNVKLLLGDYDLENKQKEYSRFCEDYRYIGRISDNEFIVNLEKIRNCLPENTKIIFLNGAEVPYLGDVKEKWIDREKLHINMNSLLKEFVDKHSKNCTIIDVNRFLTDEMPYLDTINHYKKNVYYNIASAIQEYINQDNYDINLDNKAKDNVGLIKRVYRRIKSILK